MRPTNRITATVLAAAVIAATSALAADGNRKSFSTKLFGYEEVPAVNSAATGTLELSIANNEQSVDYTLTYSGMQGTVTQSHIHFAQKGVNGGIMVWLCGTAALPGPAGTPACPGQGGSVSGTFGAGNIIGPVGAQQMTPGDLASVIDALRNGVAYANVHTTLSPGGEIRGQIGSSQP
jgi:hypothetical protein